MSNNIVVLIHGLMRSSHSMRKLGNHINKNGYSIIHYDYLSTRYHIHEHGMKLKAFLELVMKENPTKTFHFVTHSLGGIIARDAISQLANTNQCGSLIMLAPPSQGSVLAKICSTLFPRTSAKIKPLMELSSASDAKVHEIPVPKVNIGIIAGRFDAKVPPSFAQLKNKKTEFMTVNAAHTFIMNNPQTKKAVIKFLRQKTFN